MHVHDIYVQNVLHIFTSYDNMDICYDICKVWLKVLKNKNCPNLLLPTSCHFKPA